MRNVAEQHESLWILAISPALWSGHFLLCYITAAIWCGKVATAASPLEPVRVAIAIYTVVALAGIGAVGVIGYRRHRLPPGSPPHDADSPEDRHRFLGFSTLLLSALSAVAVVYAALVAVFIESCQ